MNSRLDENSEEATKGVREDTEATGRPRPRPVVAGQKRFVALCPPFKDERGYVEGFSEGRVLEGFSGNPEAPQIGGLIFERRPRGHEGYRGPSFRTLEAENVAFGRGHGRGHGTHESPKGSSKSL